MDSEKDKSPEQSNKPPETAETDHISYQTNRIPWWIWLMWFFFAIWAVFYLLVFALKDFVRWW